MTEEQRMHILLMDANAWKRITTELSVLEIQRNKYNTTKDELTLKVLLGQVNLVIHLANERKRLKDRFIDSILE